MNCTNRESDTLTVTISKNVNKAITLFGKALVKDPNYALAYAGLGDAYATKYFLTKDPQWVAEATRNAGRAVQLNSQLIPVRVISSQGLPGDRPG